MRAFVNGALESDSMSMEPLLPQYTLVEGTYTIERFLGGGTFGEVYLARHKFLGMQALKVFRPGVLSPEQEVDLFNEAFVLSKITHQNVVRVYNANTFTYQGHALAYVAMEYISGETLRQYVQKVGRINFEEAIRLQLYICDGLAQAHALTPPVVHRDVKPENILVRGDGKEALAKVADFGLARHVNATTRLIQAAGTLAYMAPEGFWGYESPASDVFSAGVIFYWLLTGREPFATAGGNDLSTQEGMRSAVLLSRQKPPVPPSKIEGVQLDDRVDSLIAKALSFEAKQRYPDALEFGKAIRALQQDLAEGGDEAHASSAEALVSEAMALAKQYATLQQAADTLESAIGVDPSLDQKYRPYVLRWRSGLML